MQKLLREYLDELNRKQKRRRKTVIAVVLAAIMLVSGVIWNLTQYGIAMTDEPKCGMEEHTHSDSCYTNVLVCGREESEGHTHTDACYQTVSELICGQEESEEHTHSEACYQTVSELICGQEESAGHTHTEACYEKQLVCGKEEHTHSEACYIDTTADVEDASIWNAQYADTKWKDAWGEDLVIAAKKQIGYKESTDNYTVAADGSHKGYTRYGQFAGDVYADWDAVFVNFCMHYAGLEKTGLFPKETETAKWHEKFAKGNAGQNAAYLTDAKDYEPQIGDILFFEKEKEETDDQMGIISSYDKEKNEIKVIEGNSDNAVKENKYAADDKHITAYLKISELETAYKNGAAEALPEETAEEEREIFTTEEAEQNVTTYTQKVGDVEVIVEAQEGTFDRPADQIYMTVDVLTTEQTEKVEEILSSHAEEKEQTVEDYVIYDINFWADAEHTEKLPPQIPVTLYLKNLNLNKNDSDVVTPICIDETDETLTEMEGSASETEVSMTVEHFTLYGVQVTAEKEATASTFAASATSTSTQSEWLANYLSAKGLNFSDGANNWQVVSGQYKGDKQLVLTEDGLLRIQKNIIPTNVENEFYIYLNMEPVLSWEEVFLQSTMWICNNNWQGNIDAIGKDSTATEVRTQTGGHVSQLVSQDTSLDPNLSTQPNAEKPVTKIRIETAADKYNEIPVSMHYGISQNSSASFTILYAGPNSDHFVKLSNITYNNGVLTIPAAAWGQIVDGSQTGDFKLAYGKVIPMTVTDPMSDYIQYLGEAVTNNGSVSFAENTLTWTGFTEPPKSENSNDFTLYKGNYYRRYAYQLAYKVRLKVEETGFNSCAEWLNDNLLVEQQSMTYSTNRTTTVDYKTTKTPIQEGQGMFTVPEVRGLLYDIEFRKVSSENANAPVPGAKFTLSGKMYSGKSYEDVNPAVSETTTSGADGYVKFRNLPWGTYKLEETEIPDGYEAVGDTTWNIEHLCYTHNRDLQQDHGNPHFVDQGNDIRNMLYLAGENGLIKNKPINNILWQIKKVSATDNTKYLQGAEFKLVEERELLEVNLRKTYYGRSDSEGTVKWYADKEFKDKVTAIPNGTYTLTEIKAPAGYIKSDKSWTIEIGPGKILVNGKDKPDEVDENTGVWTYTFENEALYSLPEAGGSGIYWYIFSGILLMAGAMLIIYKNKCKEVLKS